MNATTREATKYGLKALALCGALAAPLALANDGAQEGGGVSELAPVVENPWVEASPPQAARQPIDLAICLDTSGSMSGLIEATKQKLWAVVNDLALAKPLPRLRVALYTFGNDGHDPATGWVKQDVPLTEDLDLIFRNLFALGTNGGTELVGRVVGAATDQLRWDPAPNALKIIVVAGNESADQDQELRFSEACRRAIGRGVMVNSIYCGNRTDGDAPGWEQVARLADGQFATIDKDNGTLVVETPFDTQLSALSVAMSETYMPYGEQGAWFELNQRQQDDNAASLNGANAAQRATCKAGGLYDNGHWDLVDACRDGKVVLAELAAEQLPEALRDMTPEERAAAVAEQATKRKAIQAQVQELTTKREAYVQAELERTRRDGSRALDFALVGAIRAQATSKGFRFPEAQPPATEPPATEQPVGGTGAATAPQGQQPVPPQTADPAIRELRPGEELVPGAPQTRAAQQQLVVPAGANAAPAPGAGPVPLSQVPELLRRPAEASATAELPLDC